MPLFLRPRTLEEAFGALAGAGGAAAGESSGRAVPPTGAGGAAAGRGAPGRAALFAGGTDLMVRWRRGLSPFPGVIVDLKGIDELEGIEKRNGELRIGPAATLARIARDDLVRRFCPVLAAAAGVVACPQVRNRGTIGGNLCNASPAADTAVPLIVSGALLEIASRRGVREVAVEDFFTGPGTTVLEEGEILSAIRIPLGPETPGGASRYQTQAGDPRGTPGSPSPREAGMPPGGPLPAGGGSPGGGRFFSAFRKFGTRPSMEIAVASAGIALFFDGSGAVAGARVAFGSVAPVPLRGRGTEAALVGGPLDRKGIAAVLAAAAAEIRPISDVRASAGYRREIVQVLLLGMLEDARQG